MKNLEIAKLFYEMADLLEMKGVDWKPAAFRRAARSLEALSEDIETVAQKNRLHEIPGVGDRLASKIIEYLATGKIDEREKLLKSVPKEITQLMQVPGLGPKKVKVLFQKLGIHSVEQLQQAAKEHKLVKLAGFGEKTEQNILRGITLFKTGQERMLLGRAHPLAQSIVERLQKRREVKQIAIAGSMRRMSQAVGDIDILVTSNKPGPIMDTFTTLPEVKAVLAKGSTKSTVILNAGIQADVRVIPEESFGAALQYFTGSKDHNIALRNIAIRKGYKLSEYGLFDKKTGRTVAGSTEEGVYKKLGLSYVEPEMRENRGEIEHAQRRKLPCLVTKADIKGDLHMHTTYSDGEHSVREMVTAAAALGYEYIAITDHSPLQRIAHGVEEARLRKQWKEIDKAQEEFPQIRVLKGSEVDVKADGSLDYPDRILKELDVVIASVHLGQSHDNTDRILRALDNRYVTLLGHPTGKRYGLRESYQVDLLRVYNAAHDAGKFLEVDGQPERTDLSDTAVREAIDAGVKLTIDTDAHSVEQLQRYMYYGVGTARRGWATTTDIVNTLPLKKFEKIIAR
ncbi:DNA polymerase/3'-5' exonuclease PolX [Candidatus Woesearchaeota archaeon]|nr:DNA polymerase/3'-5' exonuclease PolX [Candidatus Woesearchaeota archaeon]